MKILLHICCGPCSIHPFQKLSEDKKNSVTGFFYNPNIHPVEEMNRRSRAVSEYAKKTGMRVIFDGYSPEDYFGKIKANTDAPLRCRICWRMRLERTAERAKKDGFDAFTSTLLVSPYQERGAILEIGSDISDRSGIKFLSDDWRSGFSSAQQRARDHGMYRQKYCGCVFSKRERFAKNR